MATILSTREQAIATVTINRPDKLNALDYETIDQLLATSISSRPPPTSVRSS